MSNKRQQVIELLEKQSFVRPRDLSAVGLPKDYLYQLEKEGVIKRVGRGLYQLPGGSISEWNSFIEAQKRVPKGVFCLLSALVFHQFTTQNPYELWMAIGNKSWRPKLDYPPVRYISMSEKSLSACVENHSIEGVTVHVYSAAKTVADCFKFKNRVGLDVAIEALKEGWSQKKFTVDELMSCADICRVSKVIQPYVESIMHT